MSSTLWVTSLILLLVTTTVGASVRPTAKELERTRLFVKNRLDKTTTGTPAFSFTLGGESSKGFLNNWTVDSFSKKLDDRSSETTVVYTDQKSGLVVTCQSKQYRDYPTVEWVLRFRNSGENDTPIIEDIRPLDFQIERKQQDEEFVVHHNQGSMTEPSDFRPFETALKPKESKRFASEGGRPMSSTMPYYNLTWGDNGLIVAISWLSDWYSELRRDQSTGIEITAGQQINHFRLRPGEEVRTPLIVLQFWQGGDRVRAHNIWRRWMVAHNLPKPGGKPFPVMTSSGIPDTRGNLITYEAEELEGIWWHAKRKLPIDIWWRDAGWYPCGNHWWNVGTWSPDPVRFPKGLKPMSDAAHKVGMKLTVWFELERAVPSTWLYNAHPEWFLGPDGEMKLLNLGNKDAVNWAVDFLDVFISEQGIDMYRQDFNMDPTSYWRSTEPEDRQGLTEAFHIEGILSLWDELKRRYPSMPFDNCAGGGRRNVVEMMRRGVPLSKTDFAGGTTSSQSQLMGLAPWLPYFGAGIGETDDLYQLRSNMAPWSAVAFNCRRDDLDWDRIRRHLELCKKLSPNMLGDFYPFTPYSLEEDVWAAWQFDLPEKGQGIVQAFRRSKAEKETMTFKLQGLDAKAWYLLMDIDRNEATKKTGKQLMDEGLRVTIASQPGASVIEYTKLERRKGVPTGSR